MATKFLSDVELDDSVRQSVAALCKYIHQGVINLSRKFYQLEKRRNYVTPTSYLELINLFKSLLGKKRKEVLFAKKGTLVE